MSKAIETDLGYPSCSSQQLPLKDIYTTTADVTRTIMVSLYRNRIKEKKMLGHDKEGLREVWGRISSYLKITTEG